MGIGTVFTVIGWVLEILTLIILVRVIFSWIPNLDPYHPVVRVIRAIADPVLAPFRGLLPGLGGGLLDLSPVLAFVVLQALAQVFFTLGQNAVTGVPFGYIVVSALAQLLLTLIIIVAILVLLRFLMVLFHADPWHPLTRSIRAIADPFCRPFEGLTTRASAIDVAALAAFIVYVVVFVVVQVVFDRLVLPLTG